MDVRPPVGVVMFGRSGIVSIRAGESKTVGACTTCALCVPDSHVSKRHFEIFLDESGSCFVRDLGSTNGTYVNGTELSRFQAREIANGDVIDLQGGVGFLVLVFPRENLDRYL